MWWTSGLAHSSFVPTPFQSTENRKLKIIFCRFLWRFSSPAAEFHFFQNIIPTLVSYCCCYSVAKLCLTFCDPMDCSSQASQCFTNCQSLLKFMFIGSVILSDHFILCYPLSLLPSIFPSIRAFSNELVLHIRWPKYWSFSFIISPSYEYSGLISFRIDWLDHLAQESSPAL